MAYDPICKGCPERESTTTPLWGGNLIVKGCDGSRDMVEECKLEARK